MGPPPPYALIGLSKARPHFFIAILAVVTEIEWMGGREGGEELVPFIRPHLALHFSDIGGISWDRHLPMLLRAFPKPDTPVHVCFNRHPHNCYSDRADGGARGG